MGGKESKLKEDVCILDHRPESKTVKLPHSNKESFVDCPLFKTRTLHMPTMGPCYAIRDIVYKTVGLKINVHRLYNRICDTIGTSGRVSLWDCISAIQTNGNLVIEMNRKRQLKKVINHFRFVRPEDTDTVTALLAGGSLVAALWCSQQKVLPVTVYGYNGKEFLVKAYGVGNDSCLVHECMVEPSKIQNMWSLVRKRPSVTECLL